MIRKQVSRRSLVIASMASGANLSSAFAGAPCEAEAKPGEWCRLLRHYPVAQVQAISPDGRWLCLNRGSSITRFRANLGEAFRRVGSASHHLVLVETGSWREALVVPLPSRLNTASFFAEGQRLLGEVRLLGTKDVRYLLIDVPSMKSEVTTVSVPEDAFYHTWACAADRVLRLESRAPTLPPPQREETYRLFRLTSGVSMEEVGRLPEGYVPPETLLGSPSISLDRRWLLHSLGGEKVVFRSCIDLQERWSLSVDRGLRFWATGVSPNGVFAVCSDTLMAGRYGRTGPTSPRDHLLVIDARRGVVLQRLAVATNACERVAISGDGCLIAAAYLRSHMDNQKGVDETLIDLIHAKTGQVLQTLVHCLTKPNDRLKSGVNHLDFTADGKYLISSGDSSRIWQLGEQL